MNFFIGGYGRNLLTARLDRTSGKLELIGSVTTPANASWVRYCAETRMLYACVETASDGDGPGRVASYRVGAEGVLTAVGCVESRGDAPCHLAVNEQRDLLAVTNYAGATVGIFTIGADGRPVAPGTCITRQGSGPHPRQRAPHPHGAIFSPEGRYLYVADLGTDEIACYEPGEATGEIRAIHATRAAAGSGPRHLLSWAAGDRACLYVVHELANTVGVYEVDEETGTLRALQSLSTLPAGYASAAGAAASTASEVQVHPSGRFVYVSNRGHDSIAVYTRDPGAGTLEPAGHFDVAGPTPRHFAIEPGGRWLLVAMQDGNYVSSYELDPDSGHGAYTHAIERVPAPSCIAFMRPAPVRGD
jgi:6-phosphogluconolactonase